MANSGLFLARHVAPLYITVMQLLRFFGSLANVPYVTPLTYNEQRDMGTMPTILGNSGGHGPQPLTGGSAPYLPKELTVARTATTIPKSTTSTYIIHFYFPTLDMVINVIELRFSAHEQQADYVIPSMMDFADGDASKQWKHPQHAIDILMIRQQLSKMSSRNGGRSGREWRLTNGRFRRYIRWITEETLEENVCIVVDFKSSYFGVNTSIKQSTLYNGLCVVKCKLRVSLFLCGMIADESCWWFIAGNVTRNSLTVCFS